MELSGGHGSRVMEDADIRWAEQTCADSVTNVRTTITFFIGSIKVQEVPLDDDVEYHVIPWERGT